MSPLSAVLYSNRALAYLKLSEEEAAHTEHPDSEWNHRHLRASAFFDAQSIIKLDVRWGKGWSRIAQVLIAVQQDASGDDVAPEHREEGARVARDGVIEALEHAVAFNSGRARVGTSDQPSEVVTGTDRTLSEAEVLLMDFLASA